MSSLTGSWVYFSPNLSTVFVTVLRPSFSWCQRAAESEKENWCGVWVGASNIHSETKLKSTHDEDLRSGFIQVAYLLRWKIVANVFFKQLQFSVFPNHSMVILSYSIFDATSSTEISSNRFIWSLTLPKFCFLDAVKTVVTILLLHNVFLQSQIRCFIILSVMCNSLLTSSRLFLFPSSSPGPVWCTRQRRLSRDLP